MFERYLREAAILPLYDAGNFGMQRRRVHGVHGATRRSTRARSWTTSRSSSPRRWRAIDTVPGARGRGRGRLIVASALAQPRAAVAERRRAEPLKQAAEDERDSKRYSNAASRSSEPTAVLPDACNWALRLQLGACREALLLSPGTCTSWVEDDTTATDDEQARGKTAARRCEQLHAAERLETRAAAARKSRDGSVAEAAGGCVDGPRRRALARGSVGCWIALYPGKGDPWTVSWRLPSF